MTRRVFKYELGYDRDARYEIDIPIGAKPLTVDFDRHGKLVLWALVDSDALQVKATVTVRGTGEPVPNDAGDYINTFMSKPFVFHAFYLQNS